MADRTLLVEQVAVSTVTVEIKTLTLGRKQMTLSVFRQLPRRSIFDPEECLLRGTPWGRVNYFWAGGCATFVDNDCRYYSPDHLHVVWQDGPKLFRACVYEDWAHNAGVRSFLDRLPADCRAEHRDCVILGWPAIYAQLEALDQLFIAV
jgi:hypothetical protein